MSLSQKLEAFSQPIALVGGKDLAKTQSGGMALSVPILRVTQLPWSVGIRNNQALKCLGPCRYRSGSEASDKRIWDSSWALLLAFKFLFVIIFSDAEYNEELQR